MEIKKVVCDPNDAQVEVRGKNCTSRSCLAARLSGRTPVEVSGDSIIACSGLRKIGRQAEGKAVLTKPMTSIEIIWEG